LAACGAWACSPVHQALSRPLDLPVSTPRSCNKGGQGACNTLRLLGCPTHIQQLNGLTRENVNIMYKELEAAGHVVNGSAMANAYFDTCDELLGQAVRACAMCGCG
jgi:hypothetical protein